MFDHRKPPHLAAGARRRPLALLLACAITLACLSACLSPRGIKAPQAAIAPTPDLKDREISILKARVAASKEAEKREHIGRLVFETQLQVAALRGFPVHEVVHYAPLTGDVLTRIFDAFTKVKECEANLKKRFEAEEKKLEADGKAIKNREVELSVDTRNPKTDPGFLKEIQALDLRKLEWTNTKDDLLKRENSEELNEIKKLLSMLKMAIRSVATAEKFDLVLRAPEFEDEFDPTKINDKSANTDSPTPADLVRKFRDNPVLYFNPAVDITDKVIAKLNEENKEAAPK